MKHKLTLLIALITLGTSTLFAESGTCGDNLTWTFENGVLYISGYGGMINYNYAGGPWDSLSNSINKIVISRGVTSIGRSAFDGCSNLTSVTIPYGVTSIGSFAFDDCSSLSSIEIPNSVTSIGNLAFCSCKRLTSITIPYSVTSIEFRAFYNCTNLTSVAILNEKIRIGDNIFENCNSIQEILFPKGLDISRVSIPTKTRKIEFVFLKAQSRLAPYKSTSPKAESNMQNSYVDLDLPSKTLWKTQNEKDLYSFDRAVESFRNKLPTKEQWQELIDECTWIWVEPGEWNYYEEMEMYEHEGDLPFYIVIGKNGNTITLPAEGCIKETTCYGCGFFGGVYGLYCSSSETKDKAFYVMDFNESEQKLYKYDSEDRNDIYSIRLVYK